MGIPRSHKTKTRISRFRVHGGCGHGQVVRGSTFSGFGLACLFAATSVFRSISSRISIPPAPHLSHPHHDRQSGEFIEAPLVSQCLGSFIWNLGLFPAES